MLIVNSRPHYKTKYSKQVLNPFVGHGFLAWNNNKVWKFIDNKEIIFYSRKTIYGGSR